MAVVRNFPDAKFDLQKSNAEKCTVVFSPELAVRQSVHVSTPVAHLGVLTRRRWLQVLVLV